MKHAWDVVNGADWQGQRLGALLFSAVVNASDKSQEITGV